MLKITNGVNQNLVENIYDSIFYGDCFWTLNWYPIDLRHLKVVFINPRMQKEFEAFVCAFCLYVCSIVGPKGLTDLKTYTNSN